MHMPTALEWTESFNAQCQILASCGDMDWNTPDLREVYLQGYFAIEALHLLAQARDVLLASLGERAPIYLLNRLDNVLNAFESASVPAPVSAEPAEKPADPGF